MPAPADARVSPRLRALALFRLRALLGHMGRRWRRANRSGAGVTTARRMPDYLRAVNDDELASLRARSARTPGWYQRALRRHDRRARALKLDSTSVTLLAWLEYPPSAEWAAQAASHVRELGGGVYDDPTRRRTAGFLLARAAESVVKLHKERGEGVTMSTNSNPFQVWTVHRHAGTRQPGRREERLLRRRPAPVRAGTDRGFGNPGRGPYVAGLEAPGRGPGQAYPRGPSRARVVERV